MEIEKNKIKVTPEDGFVDENDLHPSDVDLHGSFKGNATTVTLATSDSRAPMVIFKYICIFISAFGLLFSLIGFLVRMNIFVFSGLIAIVFSMILYFAIKHDLKKHGFSDSKEELKEAEKEMVNSVNDAFKEAKNDTFTIENYKKFKRDGIIICSIISIILFIIIAIVITINFSLVIGLLAGLATIVFISLIEFIYFLLIKKLFK